MIALLDNNVVTELLAMSNDSDRRHIEEAVDQRLLWCPVIVPTLREAIARRMHYERSMRRAIQLMKALSRGSILLEWPQRLRAEAAGCPLDLAWLTMSVEQSEWIWRGLDSALLDADVAAAIKDQARSADAMARRIQSHDDEARQHASIPELREIEFANAVRAHAQSNALVENVSRIVASQGWTGWDWRRAPHECPSLRWYELHWFARMGTRVIQRDASKTMRGSYRGDRELFCAAAYVDVVVTRDKELAELLNLSRPCNRGAWSVPQLIAWAREALK